MTLDELKKHVLPCAVNIGLAGDIEIEAPKDKRFTCCTHLLITCHVPTEEQSETFQFAADDFDNQELQDCIGPCDWCERD